MTIFFVLPAYNEEQRLPDVLEGFQRDVASNGHAVRVVIVDDGSSDGTRDVAERWSARLPLELIAHPVNRGLGETIRDGLKHAAAMAEPGDVIVSMDADNTHPTALIPRMLAQLDAGNELVIASRYRAGAQVVGLGAFRRLLTIGARLLFQAALPIRGVRDYTCGFRAYRAAVLQRAFAIHGDGLVTERSFACMAEILLKIGSMGVPIAEVPMVLRYDRKAGASKMPVSATVMKTLGLILRFRLK